MKVPKSQASKKKFVFASWSLDELKWDVSKKKSSRGSNRTQHGTPPQSIYICLSRPNPLRWLYHKRDLETIRKLKLEPIFIPLRQHPKVGVPTLPTNTGSHIWNVQNSMSDTRSDICQLWDKGIGEHLFTFFTATFWNRCVIFVVFEILAKLKDLAYAKYEMRSSWLAVLTFCCYFLPSL